MQRFFSSTTMPATDWRAPLYSHEPDAHLWSITRRESKAAAWRPNGPPAGTGLKYRSLRPADS